MAVHRTGAMGCLGLLMLAACGTAAPSSPPAAEDVYSCRKHLDHPELGEFSVRKGLTLEGAPYKFFNARSYLDADWRTKIFGEPKPRPKDYDYSISWKSEEAATTSLG